MPWLVRTWQFWKLSVYRDGAGALYMRWGQNKPKRVRFGHKREDAHPRERKMAG